MTMTRDQIAELKVRLQSLQSDADTASKASGEVSLDWCALWNVTHDCLSLLALAERALEPQGQVMDEMYDAIEDTPEAAATFWREEPEPGTPLAVERFTWHLKVQVPPGRANFENLFTARQMIAHGRKCWEAGRASQLALPAGPVPEVESLKKQLADEKMASEMWFDRLQSALDRLEKYEAETPVERVDYSPSAVKLVAQVTGASMPDTIDWFINPAKMPEGTNLYIMSQSPAVAQPGNTFAKFCGHCQKHGHTDAECNSTRGMNEPAVAQPVADERPKPKTVAWLIESYDRNDKLSQRVVLSPLTAELDDTQEAIALCKVEDAEEYASCHRVAQLELSDDPTSNFEEATALRAFDKSKSEGHSYDLESYCAGHIDAARAALCQPAEEGDKA